MDGLISSKILDNILEHSEGTAHIKDACNKKYIRSNEENLKVYNLNHEKEIIGATVHDLDDLMQSNWDKEFIDTVDELDNMVVKTKQVYSDDGRLFLNKSGILRMQYMTKYPIIDSNSIVTAIFTISKNVIYRFTLIKLYESYLSFYKGNIKLAISSFLKHTGIEQYFEEQPTEAEIKVLIAKKVFPTHKHIANALDRSVKTIDIHLFNLNAKAKSLDLTQIVAKMENSNLL